MVELCMNLNLTKMKNIFCILLLSYGFVSVAQNSKSINSIVPAGDGLYYMHYDSSGSKSTIVEFEKFIVMLEVPIKDEGGGARNLKDHTLGGEKALRSLKQKFPNKPLKYVIHSHWHPHSISSLKPFLANGSNLVSTAKNFEKLREFIDEPTEKKYKSQILYVETDSLVISDEKNKIVVYRFLQKDFPNTPTPDYLFFYLPKYSALHSGCMYNRWEGPLVAGKEVLTGREEDVNRFLTAFHVKPSYFIRLNNDYKEEKNMIPYSKFSNVIANGITGANIAKRYFAINTKTLDLKRDSLVADAIANNIPASIFNSGVYTALAEKDIPRALIFARYQVMLNPSDANAWDTLGEVYYFQGNKEVARFYENQSRLISPSFKEGGEEVWKSDLVEYQKQWK